MPSTSSRLRIAPLALFFACTAGDDPTGADRAALVGGILSTTPVGTLEGTLAVDDFGQAHYDIPIAVPPGRAGVQPELSISYDSGAGNGRLGVGFRLAGLSSITRCDRSIAVDGWREGPALAATDALCLDGKRLVFSGAGLDDGPRWIEYRTEHDGLDLVRTVGDDPGEPDGFIVRTRDGRILEYGMDIEGRVSSLDDLRPHEWLLRRVSDRSGNYYEVNYQLFDVGYDLLSPGGSSHRVPEWLPVRIDYTGYAGAAGSLPPTRSVRFTWEERPDQRTGFRYGFQVHEGYRLAKVTTYVEQDPVREIRLTYDNASATGFSRITALEECAWSPMKGSPTPVPVCKPATTFLWQKGPSERQASVKVPYPFFRTFERTWKRTNRGTVREHPTDPFIEFAPVLVLDMNGDGADDVLYADEGTHMLRLGHRAGDLALSEEIGCPCVGGTCDQRGCCLLSDGGIDNGFGPACMPPFDAGSM